MDYEQKYKNALERVRELLSRCIDYRDRTTKVYRVEDIESIFPELKESEDDRIRNALISILKSDFEENTTIFGIRVGEIIAHIEKQGEKLTDPRYKHLEELLVADDIYQISITDNMVQEAKTKAINALSKLGIGKLLGFEKQGESIKIKKGKTYLCTKTHKFAGEEWIEGIKYYSPEDYSLVNQGCTYYCPEYSKEEHNNFFKEEYAEIKPKFKVGDWIVSNLDGKARQISEVHFDEYNSYYVVDGEDVNLEEYDRLHHLWTIDDAKDGDVLAFSYASRNYILIYKRLHKNGFETMMSVYCSYCVEDDIYDDGTDSFHAMNSGEIITPTTKEQRDTLMKAMTDAGWKFDFETKELKGLEDDTTIAIKNEEAYKIGFSDGKAHAKEEMTSTWSEEDEEMVNKVIKRLHNHSEGGEEYYNTYYWLKSLKDRYTWKPTEEQIEALEHFVRSIGESGYASPYDNNTKLLYSLLEQLKKLREE